jgi:hypothetical protein
MLQSSSRAQPSAESRELIAAEARKRAIGANERVMEHVRRKDLAAKLRRAATEPRPSVRGVRNVLPRRRDFAR